ncbi:hypothetical protein WR25_23705 [Diploscapter pachys]|uniref:O-acyltransferase n=1 Tax=Diploscapter pachys TaxID=2018661 RepID=A0A2A2JDE1_9BILA|nr:hypothetical protein WR25_23705 [Diploscapter pachys]
MDEQGEVRCRTREKEHGAMAEGGKREQKGVMEFRPKHFEDRDSLLTIMYRQNDSSIVFHVFCGIFILFFLRACIDDIFVHKMPLYHTWLIWWNFAYFIPTMFVWTLMFLSTLCLYAGYKHWAYQAVKGDSSGSEKFVVAAYIFYQICFFYYSLRFLFNWQLNCACSFIITCETTRIAMKMHSFVRENWQRALQIRSGNTDMTFPTVKQFLYYQFCPTFIYRDEYPMRSTRCLKTAGIYFVQILCLIEFVNLAFTQYVFPWLSSQDYRATPVSTIALSLFAGILPGIICLLCLFYGLLHCWLNIFSELMYFGDRRFYANWWESENMAEYYRNWNLVVHDWLYAYIFRDISNVSRIIFYINLLTNIL